MSPLVTRFLIAFGLGYLLGNLNGSVLISRAVTHDDVRNHGSGNAGFTNFFRSYGGINALLVFVIDAAKAVAACILGKMLLSFFGLEAEGAALAALGVGLGHDFPALLGFRGGKGIVCGISCAFMLDWRVGIAGFIAFSLIYLCTKYVSLSSICGALAVGIAYAALHFDRPWAVFLWAISCALAIFMHHENISRLLHGTERKTDFFKKEHHS